MIYIVSPYVAGRVEHSVSVHLDDHHYGQTLLFVGLIDLLVLMIHAPETLNE